jgi:hypothetical protein
MCEDVLPPLWALAKMWSFALLPGNDSKPVLVQTRAASLCSVLAKDRHVRAIRISWRTIPCPQALFAVTTDMFENTASTINRFMSCKS